MNSMVGAYHTAKSSVSSEKDLEKRRSKKKSKSISEHSELSSSIEEKSSTKLPKSSIEVDCEREALEQNFVVTEWEHSLIEPLAGSHQKSSAEDFGSLTETKHELERTDMVLEHESTSDGSVFTGSKKSVCEPDADSEQKQTEQNEREQNQAEQSDKILFSLPRPSVDIGGHEPDEKLGTDLDTLLASTSEEPGWVKVEKTADGEIRSPFSNFVDLSNLNEALSAEKVSFGQGHLSEEYLKQYVKKKDEKQLKIVVRQNHWGADHEIRGLLWQLLCKHFHKAHEDDTYDDFALDIFGQGKFDEMDIVKAWSWIKWTDIDNLLH